MVELFVSIYLTIGHQKDESHNYVFNLSLIVFLYMFLCLHYCCWTYKDDMIDESK